MSAHPLDPLLKPDSIALIGASARDGSPGNIMADMIINSPYTGKVFPVNPGYDSLLGLPCYPDLASLPQTVEHVILAVSNERLEQALKQAIAHGARAATIYSSGVLDEDVTPPLQQRLSTMARDAAMVICGSNGMGFYSVANDLYAGMYPLPGVLPAGGISYIAQSGSAFSALAHNGCRLKFNLCVSSGNENVTTAADYMDWALSQPQTRVIGLFLESVRNPEAFIAALDKAVHKDVPVVLLKVGKSPLAAQMALTHTGAMAGNHAAHQALFSRYNVIEVNDFDELAATLMVFQTERRAGPGALATIQESGGFRELVTDIAHDLGVGFANIEDSTKTEIQKHLEPGLIAENPLDAWGSNTDFEFHFKSCLSLLMQDPNVAAGIFFTNFRDGYYLSEAFFRGMQQVYKETNKPIAMANIYSDLANDSLSKRAREADIPLIDGVRETLLAVKHLFNYRDRRTRQQNFKLPENPDPIIIKNWQEKLAANGLTVLGESEALCMLRDFSIPVPIHKEVNNQADLLIAANKIGYPLVLKTAEQGITHKSDQAGVIVNITDENSLSSCYSDLVNRLGPAVIVGQYVASGTEVGLGAINDPQFGPFIMVSAGGILIELVTDNALALVPVSFQEVDQMISSLKIDALLKGVRGQAAGNRQALIDLVVSFSTMAFHLKGFFSEIDVNPVIVNKNGAIAVDALVVCGSHSE